MARSNSLFWNNPIGAEAILHIRAAGLSDDSRLDRFFAGRQARQAQWYAELQKPPACSLDPTIPDMHPFRDAGGRSETASHLDSARYWELLATGV